MTKQEFFSELVRLDTGFHRPEPTQQRAAALYDDLQRYPLSVWRDAVGRLLGDTSHPSRARIIGVCATVDDLEREQEKRANDEASRRFASGRLDVEAAAVRSSTSPAWARFWYTATLAIIDARPGALPKVYEQLLRAYELAWESFKAEGVSADLMRHCAADLSAKARPVAVC